ncbi:GNAT family N-acetyltransferase [Candidatus Gracilibacteria bacterium]|nr:GNAT family N-acetyltransferase [Candidatus Gracilibacteria bacterium]NJM86133.1 GNAT family N-acetyltransferase [Hydrococcus sp. RU_2_2]
MGMIRRAKQEDKEFIWQVHTEAISELCKNHYTQQQIQAWTSFLIPESYREVIETREFFVVEDDKSIVGFGQLNFETGEVEAVYVSPKSVEHGLGRRILQTLENVAREKGLKSLHLSSSLNAVPFYKKAGYTSHYESKHHLPNGTELACIYMAKHLN